jgi:hypothetical protein
MPATAGKDARAPHCVLDGAPGALRFQHFSISAFQRFSVLIDFSVSAFQLFSVFNAFRWTEPPGSALFSAPKREKNNAVGPWELIS